MISIFLSNTEQKWLLLQQNCIIWSRTVPSFKLYVYNVIAWLVRAFFVFNIAYSISIYFSLWCTVGKDPKTHSPWKIINLAIGTYIHKTFIWPQKSVLTSKEGLKQRCRPNQKGHKTKLLQLAKPYFVEMTGRTVSILYYGSSIFIP